MSGRPRQHCSHSSRRCQGSRHRRRAAVTIGGIEGTSIDFTLAKGEIFFRVGKSATRYSPGEKVRAYVLDVNGSVVLLAAEVYSPNDFDTEMSAVQPIIDSIVWE